MRAILAISVLIGATASVRAQSFNVNFSDPGSTPSPAYAAAGGAGMWNTVTGVAGPTFTLFDISGTPTSVTLSQQPTATLITATDSSVSGDDAILLNHGLMTTGDETCLTFTGIAADTYEVLVYAWLPDQPTVKSRTRQDAAPSTIDVGGAWPGHHEEGITYARYTVVVTDGTLPAHSGLVPGAPAAALNAIQIRPLSHAGGDGGSIAPDGGGGANHPDAGADSGSGHHGGGCTTSGGAGPAIILLAAACAIRRKRHRAKP